MCETRNETKEKVKTILAGATEIAGETGTGYVPVLLAMFIAVLDDLMAAMCDRDSEVFAINEDVKGQVDEMKRLVVQTQEWVRQIRPGVDSHETKIETLWDTVQSLVEASGEQAKEIVALKQRLGISD